MWLTSENPKVKHAPKWQRTVYVDDDGRIFLPASASGQSELKTVLCASFDGVSMAMMYGHAYLPGDWIAREFPDERETCELVMTHIRELLPTV